VQDTTAPTRTTIDPVQMADRALALAQECLDTARVALANEQRAVARELSHEADEHMKEARNWLTFL